MNVPTTRSPMKRTILELQAMWRAFPLLRAAIWASLTCWILAGVILASRS